MNNNMNINGNNQNNNNNNNGQSSSIGDSNLLLQTDQSMDQLENQMKDNTIDQKNTILMSPSVNNTIGSPRRTSSFRKQPLPQIQRIMTSSLQALTPSSNNLQLDGPPSLSRGVSARAIVEASRQALMEMISQIRY